MKTQTNINQARRVAVLRRGIRAGQIAAVRDLTWAWLREGRLTQGQADALQAEWGRRGSRGR